jgi:predicted metal-binding membrane protein
MVSPSTLLHRLTTPVGVIVAVTVAVAWYITWATFGTMMMLTAPAIIGSTDLAVFFALILVMMVAMMLPSSLPMALAYRGITRLEGGRPTKPADALGTVAFILPYFVVWGVFGVAALLALAGLGVMGRMLMGPALFLPAGVLVTAGLWQVTRTKEVCLTHCASPMGFVLHHWRSGRLGAMRMGFRHSLYCIGCCWLFMLVLFVAGSMSLVWMGGLSVAIFVEKVGIRPRLVSRAIGVALVALGAVLAYATFVSM